MTGHLALILIGGPIAIGGPFALAYLLVQKPADEAAAKARAKAEAEKAARLRNTVPRRKELAR